MPTESDDFSEDGPRPDNDDPHSPDVGGAEGPRFVPVRLRRFRIALELSLGEVAKRVGVSHTQIHKFEQGKRVPDSEMVRALARALKLDRYELTRIGLVEHLEPLMTYPKGVSHNAILSIEAQAAVVAESCLDHNSSSDRLFATLGPHSPFFHSQVRQEKDGEMAALRLRSTLELGWHPVHDLVASLEMAGTIVVEVKAPATFTTMVYLCVGCLSVPVIAVRADLRGLERRRALAECLGRWTLCVLDERIAVRRYLRVRFPHRRASHHVHARSQQTVLVEAKRPLPEATRVMYEAAVDRFTRTFLAPADVFQLALGLNQYTHVHRALAVSDAELQRLAFLFGISVDDAWKSVGEVIGHRLDGRRKCLPPDLPTPCVERPTTALLAQIEALTKSSPKSESA